MGKRANAIVPEEGWEQARKDLLAREKNLSKLRDKITAARRNLHWHSVKEDYVFSGTDGEQRLSELFGGKSQFIIYHFMFSPKWQEGCRNCSFWAEQFDIVNLHIAERDVALAVVSRAPCGVFLPFKQRMNCNFTWLSALANTFNADYHVSFPEQKTGHYNYEEMEVAEDSPGLSVFYKDDDGGIIHTYSTYAQGIDPFNTTYQMLDLVAKGRDQSKLPFSMAWLGHHDKY